MENAAHASSPSKARIWTARILTALVLLFLLFDGLTKVLKVDQVVKASAQFGLSASTLPVIGAILLACTIVYVIPRTSVLGAILLTGYLGGAVACNVLARTPLFSNVLFPVYFGVVVWAILLLRGRDIRSLFGLGRS